MPQDTRKNFSLEIVEKTLTKQGNCCAKCGLPLTYGFDVHHKDCDNSNDSEANCQLMHPRCHDAEQWSTLKVQKEKALTQIQATIAAALEGKLAGAIIKEVNELLEKESALQNQLYGIEHFDLPAKFKVEYSEAVARANLDAFQQGYVECLKQIPNMLTGTILEKKK